MTWKEFKELIDNEIERQGFDDDLLIYKIDWDHNKEEVEIDIAPAQLSAIMLEVN